jgi:hypothetical protein
MEDYLLNPRNVLAVLTRLRQSEHPDSVHLTKAQGVCQSYIATRASAVFTRKVRLESVDPSHHMKGPKLKVTEADAALLGLDAGLLREFVSRIRLKSTTSSAVCWHGRGTSVGLAGWRRRVGTCEKRRGRFSTASVSLL